MAYVTLQPLAGGALVASLEGRTLRTGDPLWVPIDPVAPNLVRAWLPAIFLALDLPTRTVAVMTEDEAQMAFPLDVAFKRRHVTGG